MPINLAASVGGGQNIAAHSSQIKPPPVEHKWCRARRGVPAAARPRRRYFACAKGFVTRAGTYFSGGVLADSARRRLSSAPGRWAVESFIL
jgi:hypothetical protein